MRTILYLFFLTGVLSIPPSFAAESFNQLLENRQAINKSIDELTLEDVPAAFRTRVEQSEVNGLISKTFFRGDKKCLTVSWASDPQSPASRFVADVHYKGETIATVMGLSDSVEVVPARKDLGSILMISLRKDNRSQIRLNDGSSIEIIEIDGRSTRIEDDLKYLQAATMLGYVTDAIKSDIEAGKEKSAP
jgi:hypothetical protein